MSDYLAGHTTFRFNLLFVSKEPIADMPIIRIETVDYLNRNISNDKLSK